MISRICKWLGLAAATMMFALPISEASTQTKLSFSILTPPSHFSWKALHEWGDDIKKASNGELEIEFLAQPVAPPPNILTAIRNGVADGAFIFSGFIADQYPATIMSQMPWLHQGDTRAIGVAQWEIYQKYFADKEKLGGVHVVGMFHFGPSIFCSVSDKPIGDMADLKSRRIWALPGTIAPIMQDMGLAITSGPAIGIQDLVSRSTVDAYIGLNPVDIVSFKAAPYTKSCLNIIPAIQSPNFTVMFNEKAWRKLSDKQRKIIEDLSGSSLAARIGETSNKAEEEALVVMKKQGITFGPPHPEMAAAMQKSSQKINDDWADKVSKKYSVDARAILKELETRVKAESRPFKQ